METILQRKKAEKERLMEKELVKLETENYLLKRQLQKAAELNHKMWILLQDQTIPTEQLERITFKDETICS